MLSSTVTCLHSIHATKEGRQYAKPLWLPGTDLRLNTEANKLESIVYMCKVITERVTGHNDQLLSPRKMVTQ